MSRHRSSCLLLPALVVLLAAAPLAADTLVLESGGLIDTDRWWYDGDWLLYDSPAGTVGIPRSMVVRVERGPAEPRPDPLATQKPVRPARSDGEDRAELLRLMTAGRDAVEAGDFETGSSHFYSALAIEPGLYSARVNYAYCELVLGHDTNALSTVLDGLSRQPDGPELNELLGDLRDREERLDDALRAWRKAFELKPSDRVREKILKAERDQTSRRNFDFARSSHFNLRYDGEVDEALAADVSEYLEEEYWKLAEAYAHAPQQPITVLLYPNQQFRDVTRSAEWVGGLYDGKIRVPLGGLSRLDPPARRVLVHELTHAVVHSKTRGRCPRWLHEGLAQRSEGRELGRAAKIEVAEQLAGLDDPSSWAESGFSYPLALSLTGYLESRRGFDNLVWLLDLLAEGNDLDAALTRLYGEDYAALCRRWATSAKEAGRR